MKLLFPPEEYTIADSLIGATRFSWKSDVPARAVFQLSTDQSFSTITYEQPSDTGTLFGGQWKTGTYYWRVRSLNVDGSVFHDTGARSFRIVDPPPQPRLVSPEPGSSFYLRKEDPYTFSWDKVTGADYYQFKLYYVANQDSELLRYSSTQEGTKVELPLGEYQPGAYRILLQAFGLDKESSTRLIGYLGRIDFTFKLITRMSLSSPANGSQFLGLDARRHGISLSWSVPDKPQSSQLIVSTDPGLQNIVMKDSADSGAALAKRLPAGVYYWTVKGTFLGFDLSALETNRFSVQTIPPLPAPSRLSPSGGFVFGPQQLRNLPPLHFAWDAVPDATCYAFALYRGTDADPFIHVDSLTDTSYDLDDISVLQRTDYRWTVKALAYDANGELEQDGTIAEGQFRIDLPGLATPSLQEGETFYGR